MPKGVYLKNKLPKGKKQYPQEMVLTVRRLYMEERMTKREVARELHVSTKVVHTLMKNHGIKARKAIKRDQRGSKNASWKGCGAGYKALHLRVHVERGKPERCGVCGTSDPNKVYNWANLTGNYADVSDYKRMCVKCHQAYDDGRRGHRPQQRTDVTSDVVCKMRADGMSVSKIARKLNCSWTLVKKRMIESERL